MNNTLKTLTIDLDMAISSPSHLLYHFKGTISRKVYKYETILLSAFDNAKLIVFRTNRRKITGANRNYHQLAINHPRRNRWRTLR
ncbi:protein of unknown function [Streptococcus thermophilus]|nr:protein of unknown function [Streptococcus thermophilus]CAD0146106.1 protein of unknown function [Streptococcus thermophilus]CAD0146827.1 protein of unknown function [Streptococcus thermophilus]CAD0151338.1 protein of unknown function [Streptococcus thermophilus]